MDILAVVRTGPFSSGVSAHTVAGWSVVEIPSHHITSHHQPDQKICILQTKTGTEKNLDLHRARGKK